MALSRSAMGMRVGCALQRASWALQGASRWAVPAAGVRLTSSSGSSGSVSGSGSGLSAEGQSILDHLLRVEKDAEALYKDLAARAKTEGFRKVFTLLASEEAKHTEWMKQLAQDGELGPTVKVSKTFLGDMKAIVEAMKESRKDLNALCSDQKQLYTMARDIEVKSRDFYRERAVHARDPALRKLFTVISLEEDRHGRLLDGLLDYVTFENDQEHEMEQPNLWFRLDEQNVGEMGKL